MLVGLLPRALSSFCVLAIVGLPLAARGQATSSLSWTRAAGAESCVGASELARRVEGRLGRPALVSPSQAQLSIEGRVTPRRGGGWSAAVVLARAAGEIVSQRTLETREPSCRALDDALVLVIALLVDPDGAPPPAPDPAPRVVIREVVREVRVPVAVREPWGLGARTGVEVEHGAMPGIGVAVTAAVAVDPPGVPPVEARAFITASGSEDADLAGRSAELRVAGGELGVCPAIAIGRLRTSACAALRVAWLRWRGVGFEQPASGSVIVPALAIDGRVALPLWARLSAFAAAGARVPLRRTAIIYEESPSVAGDPAGGEVVLFRADAVSVWVGVGLAVAFF